MGGGVIILFVAKIEGLQFYRCRLFVNLGPLFRRKCRAPNVTCITQLKRSNQAYCNVYTVLFVLFCSVLLFCYDLFCFVLFVCLFACL